MANLTSGCDLVTLVGYQRFYRQQRLGQISQWLAAKGAAVVLAPAKQAVVGPTWLRRS